MKTWIQSFKTLSQVVSWKESLRSSIGACIGVFVAGLSGLFASTYFGGAMPWLMASVGASAMLVFAISTSPLAQPWAVIIGNTISCLAGLLCLYLLGPSMWGAATSVLVAMVAMFMTRSLHPPGAATALFIVLNPQLASSGVFLAVVLNSIILVIVGVIYNNLTGKSYPHRVRVEFVSEHTLRNELEIVLKKHNEIVDISVEDLEALIQEASALKNQIGASNKTS